MATKSTQSREEVKISAAGRKIGRLASEVAVKLRGKDVPGYRPNIEPTHTVRVEDISALDIPQNKLREKTYISHSGYPGGRKSKTLEEVIAKHGRGEILRRAVYGMLPDNKLRKRIMKNLIIEEE